MKKIILFSVFCLMATLSYAQPQASLLADAPKLENEFENEETGEIIFIRRTGISGSAVAIRTFIGEDLVCKINNKRYSKHQVKAGQYKCVSQFYGKKRNAKRDPYQMEVKAGEKKYLMLVLEYGWLFNRLSTVEISEASALKMIADIKEDKKY